MIRARFMLQGLPDGDYRPVKWPIKHPYWCSGYRGDDVPVIVAYADDEAQILELWPEAVDIDAEEVDSYTFTGRFPKPDWFTE